MRQERLLKKDKDKLIETLIKLRNDGFTQKEAAEYVGRKVGAISAFCHWNGIRGAKRNGSKRPNRK